MWSVRASSSRLRLSILGMLVTHLGDSKKEDDMPQVLWIQVRSNCREVGPLAQEVLHRPGASIDGTCD